MSDVALPLGERGVPPPQSARLMLLDTYGLVYRAFFALPALTTTHGLPINAAYGFTMMLTKLIADEKPTHVIAAFDKGLPAARVAMYPQYKAQRDEMPNDLRGQFVLVRKILACYGIPILEIEGEEADDVMATLARIAGEDGQRAIVVTGDLDMLQTVDDTTTVLTTRRGITDLGRYDAAAVRERFDLEPHQLPDYRGLKGDPSDNLPGIPGVGEKTAIKLVKAAGSLDALLAEPKLAGTAKLEALVREHGEMARTCRDVSIIKRDLPLVLDWSAAQFTQPANEALYALYREFEFKGLLAKLTPPANPVPVSTDELLQGAYTSYVAATDLARLREAQRVAARRGAEPARCDRDAGRSDRSERRRRIGLCIRLWCACERRHRRSVHRGVERRSTPGRARHESGDWEAEPDTPHHR